MTPYEKPKISYKTIRANSTLNEFFESKDEEKSEEKSS